jgi:hypothetical protein
MEKNINDFKLSLETRALEILSIEMDTEKDKVKLRAYWKGIVHFLDLPPDSQTLRYGFGWINALEQ